MNKLLILTGSDLEQIGGYRNSREERSRGRLEKENPWQVSSARVSSGGQLQMSQAEQGKSAARAWERRTSKSAM